MKKISKKPGVKRGLMASWWSSTWPLGTWEPPWKLPTIERSEVASINPGFWRILNGDSLNWFERESCKLIKGDHFQPISERVGIAFSLPNQLKNVVWLCLAWALAVVTDDLCHPLLRLSPPGLRFYLGWQESTEMTKQILGRHLCALGGSLLTAGKSVALTFRI